MVIITESKKDENEKTTSINIAIITCVLTYIFLTICYIFILHRRHISEDFDSGATFKLSGSFFKDIGSRIFENTTFYVRGDERKELLKVILAILVYNVCLFYIIKEMSVTAIAILLPLIFILTLPMMFKHVFKMYSFPTEEPFVVFLLLVLTGNLWYTFSHGDNVIDANSKSISVNMSIIFVLLYIIFKRVYGNSTSQALMKSISLTGATGIFMISAPMYVYTPKIN
jgi:hypothetical protein